MLVTLSLFPMGSCDRIRNRSEGWHTGYGAAVRQVKTIQVIKVEKRSIYTKVATERKFKGSRDQLKVVYLDPLHNRPGNFVVFFLR